MDWSTIVPAIVIINLLEREDRRREVLSEVDRVGMTPLCTVLTRPTESNAKVACFRSHQAACQWALDRGLDSVLILEDDVTFTRNDNDLLTAMSLLRAAVGVSGWDVILLGHFAYFSLPGPGIVQTLSVMAHAYVASRGYMQYLVRQDPTKVAVDWHFLKVRTFAVCPMIAFQRGSPSSIGYPSRFLTEVTTEPYLRAWEGLSQESARSVVSVVLISSCVALLVFWRRMSGGV